MAVFDSGWVEIPQNNDNGGGASFTFDHGLGTDKLTGAIYYTDQNQNSMVSVGTSYDFSSKDSSDNTYNAMLSISDTQASVNLGMDGYATHSGASEWRPLLDPTYIKLILISSEESSPGSGGSSGSGGGLCRLSAAESGYQMFGNGLIMQWFSSNEITIEQAYDITFPTPFSSKPFKVIVSTRYPTGDGSSQIWFQTIDWNKDSVQFYAQAQSVANFTGVIADFYAIGLATPADCSGDDGASAVDGVKISQLQPLSDLKDDDLFVLSRDNESDGLYDNSNKITFDQIKTNVLSSVPDSSSSVTFIAPKLILANPNAHNPTAFQQIDLSADLPIGAQGCILQVEYYVTGPNDLIHAEIYLREEQNSATQYKILYTSAFGGGDAVASNVQGFYPIHQASRSVWIGVPQRGPDRYEIYLVGYF